MEQEIRNKLRNVVTKCRTLLEKDTRVSLEGKFRIYEDDGKVVADADAPMGHLTVEEQAARKDILDHLGHIRARGFKPKDALNQLVREIAFTHLNRFCAYKMMEAREVYVGGQKFREAVSRSFNSNGVKFYLADHPEDERLFNSGHQHVAYRHFLDWLGGLLSAEIGVLFNPNDSANRLYPRQTTIDEVLDMLNGGGIKPDETELREAWPKIWSQDETIGWVYQYFTPKEIRDQARRESLAPRNSYELAFRNQFFTPRYVVEFLTDNTLGRFWYEIRKGVTELKEQCRYLLRRPNEIFLKEGEQPPQNTTERQGDLSQEELLKLPVHIPHRPKKDPRELRILDPACGSGHFLLYCFDLLLTIYEEAYSDPELGPALQNEYPTLEELRRQLPGLILARNLHGIDIDLRASQIAALALWLRCQRAYKELGLKKDHPPIKRSNFVCAEPMPGEKEILKEFVGQLEPKLLGQLVEVVFDRMSLVGEAGSLLKVEEEIQDAVKEARKQWARESTLAVDRKGRTLLFTEAEIERLREGPTQSPLFDVSDISEATFFERAEQEVVRALRGYAERTQNGQRFQRRLFTDDAERGFAFVELCHKHYDVVLMNPPFGEPSIPSKPYLSKAYVDCKDDVDAAFVKRGTSLLGQSGFLGAIINRTQFFKGVLDRWRSELFLDKCTIDTAADLGLGVLDGAMVEAATYVIRKPANRSYNSVFFRVLKDVHKCSALGQLVDSFQSNSADLRETFLATASAFRSLPENRISYWASRSIRSAFSRFRPLEGNFGYARQGLITADNFRFLRLAYEVPAGGIALSRDETQMDAVTCKSKPWVYYPKGGEYSPFYGDIHLVVNWDRNGTEIQNFLGEDGRIASRPQNQQFYFAPAITYTERTASGFSPRVMPRGCIFDCKGPIIQAVDSRLILPLLSIAMSRVFALFLELSVASGDSSVSVGAARQYTQSIVGSVPIPELSDDEIPVLGTLARDIWSQWCEQDGESETSRYFTLPSLLISQSTGSESTDLAGLAECALRRSEDRILNILEKTWTIEQSVRKLYALDEQAVREIDEDFGPHPITLSLTPLTASESKDFESMYSARLEAVIDEKVDEEGGSRVLTKKCYYADRQIELLCAHFHRHPSVIVGERRSTCRVPEGRFRQAIHDVISYSVGCAFGRWDVAMKGTSGVKGLDPLASLPRCAPGALHGPDYLPLTVAPEGYPLRIEWDGILTNDEGNESDIVHRVRMALEVLWQTFAEAREKESCQILGVKELREYFGKTSKGGFWEDHIARYTKSRRKAPIYWLLQSSRKNYALWLYYHRLDKDQLFKALVNYVEPKVRLETSNFEALQRQRAAAGESGKEAKRIAKDVERQEDLLSELRDFEDKLRKAANLHLEPDLNDGVVLNIAPLRELVPWNEAEKYWNELLEGGYEWSSIGKQLRQKGLVK